MNRIERTSRLSARSSAKTSLVLGFVLACAACGREATPQPIDPSQAAGTNAAGMGKARVPTFEEIALKNALLDREHALAAASVEEDAEARAAESGARRDHVEPMPDRSPVASPAVGTPSSDKPRSASSTSAEKPREREDAPRAAAGTEASRSPEAPLPRSVTAMDQSEKRTDLRITQDIRRAVVSDPSLSFAAKNVTVVTVRGHVVLKGTVKDSAERAAVSAKAARVAGEGRVDARLLEVQK